MTGFNEWFDRCVGDWTSQRRYIFNMKTKKPTNLTTDFSILESDKTDWDYSVVWTGQTKGTMYLKLEGEYLHRDVGYFTDEPTSSLLHRVDHDTIAFYIKYDGMRFREEIRFCHNDNLRLRQTVGFKIETGELTLCGQYLETRIL